MRRVLIFSLAAVLTFGGSRWWIAQRRERYVATAMQTLGIREQTAVRVWQVARAEFAELADSHQVREMSPDERRSLAVQAPGMGSSESLQTDWQLHQLWAQRDERFCAAVWAGASDVPMLDEALLRATDAELRAWVQLRVEGSMRVLAGLPLEPMASAHAARDEGMREILAGVSVDEREVLERAYAAGDAVAPADACAAAKVVLANAGAVEDSLRWRFVAASLMNPRSAEFRQSLRR